MSNIYMILHAVALVAYPIWLYCFLTKNYANLADEKLERKYSNAFGNIQLDDNPKAIWQPILYLLRRLALACICVCLINFSIIFQFAGLFASQVVAVIFLGQVRPQESKFSFKMDLFNEAMIIILIYHLMCFTDLVIIIKEGEVDRMLSYERQDNMGSSMIVFTLLLLGVNLGLLGINAIRGQLDKCRQKKYAKLL